MTCDVCNRPLCGVGPATTGICARCRMDGAAFADAWLTDLLAAGETHADAAAIVGVSPKATGRRVTRARRRAMEVAHAA